MVTENDTIRQTAYDFRFTYNNNYRCISFLTYSTISVENRNFLPPVCYLAPLCGEYDEQHLPSILGVVTLH